MNLTARIRAFVLCALVTGASACGGSDDGETIGREFTDAELCMLHLDQSTEANVTTLFGTPYVRTNASIGYTYQHITGDPTNTKSFFQVTTSFSFDNSGKLTNADRTAIGNLDGLKTMVPTCLVRSGI